MSIVHYRLLTWPKQTVLIIVSMENKLKLQSLFELSDDALLRRLSELLKNSRHVEAELIAHIGEVDHRNIFRRFASSMFKYCTEQLNLTEYEAYLRI